MPTPPPVVPAFTVNGIPVTVYLGDGDGSEAVQEQYTQDGAQATVLLKCPWVSRYVVVKGLMGSVTPTTDGTSFSRTLPATYPPSTNLFCTSINSIRGIQPVRDDAGQQGLKGWVTYTWAVISATFSRPTWQAIEPQGGGQEGESTDPSGIIYATTRFKVSAEAFTPPFGVYYWQGGQFKNKPVQSTSLTQIIPRIEISLTRHMMPFPGVVTAANLVGCVNAYPWVLANYNFKKGTVLFMGTSTDPKADPATQVTTQDIEMSFLANAAQDWNQFLSPDGTYQFIATTQKTSRGISFGGNDTPFPYVDFGPLFGAALI